LYEQILSTLGLALRAGRLEVGEEPVGGACRGRIARLILVAADAAPNTHRRAAHFGEAWNVMCLPLPFRKDELGRALGRSSCAVAAVTDYGFAASILQKLAQMDPLHYADAALELTQRATAPRHRPPASPPPAGHRPPSGPRGAKPRSRPGPRPAAPPASARSRSAAPPKPKASPKPGAASRPGAPPRPKPGSSRGGGRGGFGPGPRR